MKKIPIFDTICEYAIVVYSYQECCEALKVKKNEQILYVGAVSKKEEGVLKKQGVLFLADEDELKKYINIPMWVENTGNFNSLISRDYDNIFPMSAEVVPSLNCPFRCEQCSYKKPKQNMNIWELRNIQKSCSFQMTFSTMDIIVKRLQEAKIRHVVFTGGGEPLCNFDVTLHGIIRANQNGIETGLYTNGYHLSKENISKLLDTKLKFIRISVYGIESVSFNKYTSMEATAYFRIINNIKMLLRERTIKKSQTKIALSFLVHPNLIPDISKWDKFIDYFTKEEWNQIDYIRFTPAVNYFGDTQHKKEFFEEVFAYIEKYKTEEKKNNITVYWHRLIDLYSPKEYKNCFGSGYYAEIGPNGKMYLCCEKMFLEKYCIGDLKKSSIKKIWQEARIGERIVCEDCPNICKPHEINKQINRLNTLLCDGLQDEIIQWRKDLIESAGRNGFFPGHLNAFES